MSNKSLGHEIMDLVPASQARELFCDYGELALDLTMDEGVMKDLPFIGTLIKIGGCYFTIRDKIFLKKVAHFLRALDSIQESTKADFLDELDSKNMRIKVGEKVILLLNRQDDIVKSDLIGIAFSHYINGT